MKDRRITIYCYRCKVVELTEKQYLTQLCAADMRWFCPNCLSIAEFNKIERRCVDPYCSGWVDEDYDICPICEKYQFEFYLLYGLNGIERWQQCYKNEEIEYAVEWNLNVNK